MAVAAAGPSSPSPSALTKQHLGRILASTPVSSSLGIHSSVHELFSSLLSLYLVCVELLFSLFPVCDLQ